MEDELPAVIAKYMVKYEEGQQVFTYQKKSSLHTIATNKIGYLLYWNHTIKMKLINGNTQEFRGSVMECEEQLSSPQFYKPNNGAIINIRYCDTLKDGCFVMKDKHIIQISRDRKREALKTYMEYQREEG